jgi:hypothetical protein
MMNHRILNLTVILGMLSGIIAICFTGLFASGPEEIMQETGSSPGIDPDYSDVTLPPNIAPCNFVIQESGIRYRAEIRDSSGHHIRMVSKNPLIRIPEKKWRQLLNANPGHTITIVIDVMNPTGVWQRYHPIINRIACEPIDNHLVYRLLKDPIFEHYQEMGIYQRDLTSYHVTPVLEYKTIKACFNCHAFQQNDPDRMLIHVRGGKAGGTLLVQNSKVFKLDTRTPFNSAPGAYRSWHPGGKLIAFSVNRVYQFFHAAGSPRDVYDAASDLIVYDIEKNTVFSCPKISTRERLETYPEWSPDGRTLYFCSAPSIDHNLAIQFQYENIRYDLMCISYHSENGSWGEPVTVLPAAKTGRSITHPKVSPDGRFLLFCMSDYGNFSIYRKGGDLYILDLETGTVREMPFNSDQPDSYHCWSSNSRWFVFSSKRRTGITTQVYFSYVDRNGNIYKPFILPQKDPAVYNRSFDTFNVPELVKGPVKIHPQVLTRAAFSSRPVIKAGLDPALEAEAVTRATEKTQPQSVIE